MCDQRYSNYLDMFPWSGQMIEMLAGGSGSLFGPMSTKIGRIRPVVLFLRNFLRRNGKIHHRRGPHKTTKATTRTCRQYHIAPYPYIKRYIYDDWRHGGSFQPIPSFDGLDGRSSAPMTVCLWAPIHFYHIESTFSHNHRSA